MTEDLKLKMTSRDQLREKARLSKLPEDWEKYKKKPEILCVKEIKTS